MAIQIGTSVRRRRTSVSDRPVGGTRHPLVAIAIALPCAILLAVAFGGWHEMLLQTEAFSRLIGR